jgi:hypothetical protein
VGVGDITIIAEDTRPASGRVHDGRLLIDVGSLPDAIGWQLKPEGLCRDDVCVPVRDRERLSPAGNPNEVDIAAVAAALGRVSVVDAEVGVAAVALPAERRRHMLATDHAPAFSLPDLDGTRHEMAQWHGQKRLLVAFATW